MNNAFIRMRAYIAGNFYTNMFKYKCQLKMCALFRMQSMTHVLWIDLVKIIGLQLKCYDFNLVSVSSGSQNAWISSERKCTHTPIHWSVLFCGWVCI